MTKHICLRVNKSTQVEYYFPRYSGGNYMMDRKPNNDSRVELSNLRDLSDALKRFIQIKHNNVRSIEMGIVDVNDGNSNKTIDSDNFSLIWRVTNGKFTA